MSLNSFRAGILASILVEFLLPGFASAQTVINGDFENVSIGPPFLSTSASDIPGWTRSGSPGDGLLARVGFSDPDGSITVAGHGSQFVILGGGQNSPGTAAWTTTVTNLTPNTTYTLSFLIANEGEAFSQSITASFPAGSSTPAQTFSTSSGANQLYWKSWESKAMQFVATSTSATLQFSVANQRYDIGLDYVQVTPQHGAGSATVIAGPVMTNAVPDPSNNCPGFQPASTASFAQNAPIVVVWFALGGLSTGDHVLVRFYDNNGTLQSSLDNAFSPVPSPGSFAFCGAFLPNGGAGVGTWSVSAFVNGQGLFTLPFQITSAGGGGGGGVTVDLLNVFRQLNLAAATYTNTDVLASQGLTIVPNVQGQVPTGAPLGTGTLLIGAVGTNQVHPPGTASTAQFIGPNFTSNALTCVSLSWTGTGSLTGFSATRIGVSNGGSIPAWAMYAYSASGTLLDTKGEGNITTGGFSQPSNYASFTVSSSTPIARVVLCSHNGASTYGVVPFSAGTSLGSGGGGGGLNVSGTYICTWGPLSSGPMTLTQTGTSLTGTLPNGGSLSGTVTVTSITIIFTGTWISISGAGTITFTSDGVTITGTWTRSTGSGDPAGSPATSSSGTVTGTKSTGGGGGVNVSGTYICTWGPMSSGPVTITQNGTGLTGTLPNGGSLSGTVTVINITIIFTGTWISISGNGSITFTSDGVTITGTWTRSGGTGDPTGSPATSSTGTVTGTKTGGGGGVSGTISGITIDSHGIWTASASTCGLGTQGNWTLGVSNPDLNSPLLNKADRSVSLTIPPPSSYYLYAATETYAFDGNQVKITLCWADGRPNDVAVFQTGDLTKAAQMTKVSGPDYITLATTGLQAKKVPSDTNLIPNGRNNDVLLLGIAGGGSGGGPPGGGGGTTSLPIGNILLTVGNTGAPLNPPGTGKVLMFTPTGTLAGTLNDQSSSNGAMGFDNSGNLYVANYDSGTLSKFDAKASLVASKFAFTYSGGNTQYPESIATDIAGNIYVGGPGGNLGDPRGSLYKFSPSGGASSQVYNVFCPEGNGGADWIELSADQHTVLYTCARKGVYSVDLNSTPSSPNSSLNYNPVAGIPPASDPAQEQKKPNRAYALRIIPTGPYAGDLLVATRYGPILVNPNIPIPASNNPSCASPSGPLLKCYTVPATVDGYVLSLDPNPNGITDFWMAEQLTGNVWKVNIATGNVDPKFTFNCNCTQSANNIGINGILIAGEQTAGMTGKSGPGTPPGGGGNPGGGGSSVTVDVSPRFTNDSPPYPAACAPTPRSNTFAPTDPRPQLVFRVTGLTVGQDVVATTFIGPDGQPVAGLGGNFNGPAKFNPDCFNDGTFNPATAAPGAWTVKATLNGSTQLFSLSFTVTGGGNPGGGGPPSGSACRVDITSAKGANFNLTTEGTADWYHMGLNYLPTGCQTNGNISGSPVCTPALRKSGGSQLSNLTFYTSVQNSTGYVHPTGDDRTATWSDGAPTQSGNTGGALAIEHGGFKFTAPADQQQRTLMLHIGGVNRDPNANWTLTAHVDGLTDQPVTQVMDPSGANDIDYKIVYQAPQAGQITVSMQVNHANDEVVFQAVALSQPVTGSSCSGTSGGGGNPGGGGSTPPITVNTPPQQIPPSGGTGTVTATPPAGTTTVTATPSEPWIIIISISGGTITFSVPANTGGARVGVITVSGAGALPTPVPISQNAPNAGTGPGGCTYPLQSNTVQTFDVNGNTPSGGTTGFIRFLTAPTCAWTASVMYPSGTTPGWITIQSPGTSGTGNGAISFTLTPNTTGNTRVGAIVVQGQVTVITQDGGPPPGTPAISSGGILNAASYADGGPPNGLAQGSFFSIFGTSLGPDQFLQAGYPIPDSLGGVSVQIVSGGNTYKALLVFVSAVQINGLIPSNVPVGPAQVIVSYNGKSSAIANILISKTSFGVFFQPQNGNNVGVAQNVRTSTDYPLNLPSVPAKPGQIVIMWGTGLGPINGPDNVAPGSNAFDMRTAPTNLQVAITVGGQPLAPQNILYAGRQSEAAGVDNIYFTLPANVQLGCNVPVAITVNGIAANTTTIAISADGSPCSNTPPANNGTINTTLTVAGSGTVTSSNVSASGTVTLSGIGTGTLTSNFSLASAAVSGSAPLTLNITSGSRTGSLTTTLTGSLTLLSQVFAGDPNSSGPATVTVTSGTGGFAGAKGTFNVTAAGTGRGSTGSGSGSFSLNGPGTLTIP